MNEEQLRRLSDCEKLINKYHDRIVEYMLQCDNYSKQIISKEEFQRIWEDFNNRMSRDFGMLRKEMVDLHKKDEDVLDKVDFLNNELVRLHFEHHQMINRQGAHIEKLLTDSENMFMLHNSHKTHIEGIQQRLNEYEKFTLKTKENFQLCNASHQEQINQLSRKLEGIEAKFQLCNSNNTMNHVLLEDQKNHVNTALKSLQTQIEAQKQEYSSLINSMAIQLKSKIDNIPKPEPIVFPNFNKMLADQQEDTLLKVSIKAEGIDQALEQAKINKLQMIILDKKLEKILSILSNNDLK